MSVTMSRGRHVVVAGGGFAGLAAAFTLRQQLGPNDRVTVVEPSGRFVFALSQVWAVLGIMPPFTGAVDIWKSTGLTDHHGFVPVNERYQHVKFSDIFAARVACTFDRPVPPLTGPRAPHTGYLAVRMGRIAAQNVATWLGSGPEAGRTLPYVFNVRLLDGGTAGLFLTSWGTKTVRNAAIEVPGPAAHYLKTLQERYLVWRL